MMLYPSAASTGGIRYARCWEDADVLLAALDIQPGDTCLSIGSAGDNTLALLCRAPGRVMAIDQNPAQIACLALRVAAYRCLRHSELLELIGVQASTRRMALYQRCRGTLDAEARAFWDAHPHLVAQGIGTSGKFERYLMLFRRWCLRLAHGPAQVAALFRRRTAAARHQFYAHHWNNRRWRMLLRLFCSRWLLARLGRDAACFAHARGNACSHIAQRVRHVLTTLDPADNPYVQELLAGTAIHTLPVALRPEHFATIRANLERLEWQCTSLQDWLATCPPGTLQRCNLSDVFEYLAPDATRRLFAALAHASRPGVRLAYWNMQVPRMGAGLRLSTPAGPRVVRAMPALAAQCYAHDRVPFYSQFVVETIEAEPVDTEYREVAG
jgi:S-adenosylmethionine-diacylglycerol 3-amino-3-carboxypropyl transferase